MEARVGWGKQINRLKDEIQTYEIEFENLKIQCESAESENHQMRELLLSKVNARIAKEEGTGTGTPEAEPW